MDRNRLLIAAGCCLLLCSCGREMRPSGADATYAVTGEVSVDGSPVEGVRVICHSDVPDQKYPTASLAVTDADGKFALAT
jgi:hypothetical protein